MEEEQQQGNQSAEKLIGGKFRPSDLFKLGGLLAFFALMAGLTSALWPYIHGLFEEGGLPLVIQECKNAGLMGVLVLLALQFLQIVVALIPGEITQIAAGMLYGPFFGLIIIILGAVISSAFVFVLVRKLGAPFVQALVSTKHLERFEHFEQSGKLEILVFILFLIPGLPKDTFTYLIPLTHMEMKRFVFISNVARIPGVFMTTFASNDLLNGDYLRAAIVFCICAAISVLGIVCQKKIVHVVEKVTKRH